MQKSTGISVVIPNFNGSKIIVETIQCAIHALETSHIHDYEIIVSDDASSDDSIVVIESNFKNVIIAKTIENTGFAGNVNRGISISTKELILLLNSDFHLTEGYFKTLVPLFSNEKTFGVMGAIKDVKTLEYQDCAKYPKIFLYNIESNKNIMSDEHVLPTFFLSGANALIRADYLIKIGIMGCIVNGPGEMADADYGYVGTGPGKINLYKEKIVVRKNVAEDEAVQALIDLIKEHGDWVEVN